MKRFYISYIYSVFILELTEKPEKTVCFTEANPTLKSLQDYMDTTINMLSPGCPASSLALQILAPQLSTFVVKPY